MKLNTAALAAFKTETLTAFAAALDFYVQNKPQHNNGLCSWVSKERMAGDFYELDEALRPDGPSYVERSTGPTPARVEYAKEVAWAIAVELKRREQPKEPRKPHINLKKASLQRIFEFGLRHGRKQGQRCHDKGNCLMRGPNGMACIVGSMIDDDIAAMADAADITSKPDLAYDEWRAVIGSGRKAEVKAELLGEMQRAHDRAFPDFLPRFEDAMQDIAWNFKLVYKQPGVTLRA